MPRLTALLAGQGPAVAARRHRRRWRRMPEKPADFAATLLSAARPAATCMVRAAAAAALGELKPAGGARALADGVPRPA